MARSRAAVSAVVLVVVMMALVQGSMADGRKVGEDWGWQPPPNITFYQDWAHSYFPYHTTESLVFTWIEPDSVLQVTYADFTKCNTTNPIQSWVASPGGLPTTMEFELKGYSYQTLYFISGSLSGYNCAGGQKFFIDVFE